MEIPSQEGWKFVLTVCGVECVVNTGTSIMQKLFAHNWDYHQHVSGTSIFNSVIALSDFSDPRPIITSTFGEGDGPIVLDNLQCNGNEDFLTDCPHNGVGIHMCTHYNDASVFCADSKYQRITIHYVERELSFTALSLV